VRLADLHYDLPPELIAQQPAPRRDESRLLVLERSTGRMAHRVFRECVEYFRPNDCLVLNDTRVIPARFFTRRSTGGRVEGLFLHEDSGGWHVLLKPTARLRVGERLLCEGADVYLRIVERGERGAWRVRPEPELGPLVLLSQIGHTPLPPYIRRDYRAGQADEQHDAERYQTVYARRPGAVAAPTAGLHFTTGLLDELARRGVRRAEVTLHVGAGTFLPIEVEDLAQHRMQAEWFEVSPSAAESMHATRLNGGRIIAVGTTVTRVLESLARLPSSGEMGCAGAAPTGVFPATDNRRRTHAHLRAASGWTDLFIYPPFEFLNVDVLLTNFHLPGSTLLALVMAFASPELIRTAYQVAIRERYRFYSYGDAMLIV